MKKKRKDGFTEVSAFSKTPFRFRFLYLGLAYSLLVLSEIFISKHTSSLIEFLSIYVFIILLIWLTWKFICLRIKFNRSPFKKLQRYIQDNKLYEEEMREVGINEKRNVKRKNVIYNSAYFSYKVTDDELIIRAWKNADKFTDKANTQDTMLSALFGRELYKKYDNIQYCDYVFELKQDKRLTVGKSEIVNGYEIQMTEKIKWQLGKPPHALVVGGTGSGKTYLVNMLILDYLRMGAKVYIADPKSADLAVVGRVIDIQRYGKVTHTATSENEIAKLFREANEEMEKRYREWFADENSFGKTWKDIPNTKPLVIVFDEYAAFASVSSQKVVKEVNGYLFNLILKGRQAGIEVVMVMQRPDANILSGNLRDQFGVRIGLGNITEDGRKMLFGSLDMEYKTITEIGGGYIMIDSQHTTPVYFETPLISGGIDYIGELHKAIEGTQNHQFNPSK
ncbi:FtsK/SpoIIIE domain-containing protein [Lysinibacillus capsici]|uniref:FtsK/SpoIIIE domain-containing protein n=1 Tax=Lysinibacillus capsici TaxID=2115968 RepID=UPI002FDD706C